MNRHPLGTRGATLATLGCLLAPALPLGTTRAAPLPPALIGHRFVVPDTLPDGSLRPLRQGDTLELWTRWTVPDSAALTDSVAVTADFSLLDPGAAGNAAVAARREPEGVRIVTYTLSGVAARADTSGIPIPLTAAAPSGTTIDRRIEVCLSNAPPAHVTTFVVDPKGAPYRTGDSLLIETVWRTSFREQLRLVVDFGQILVDTSDARPRVIRLGGDVYRVHWRFPFDSEQMLPDGLGKHVRITARDAGCGQTTFDFWPIDVDTQPPDAGALVLDPLPPVTSADSIAVTGSAPNAAVVLVYRDLSVKDVVEPDSVTFAFRSRIALLPGENRIQIKAEDLSGNPTPLFPESPVLVQRAAGATLNIGTPYSRDDRTGTRGDDIRLLDATGMEQVLLRVFSLEGDCLREERSGPGRMFEFGFHWDGRDRSGRRAPQGYYLVQAKWRDGSGHARVLNQGLLLRD